MKKLLFIACAALIFTSCFDENDSQYTPRIGVSPFICNNTDTLNLRQESDGYRLDTITIGDTVRFVTTFDALGNNLLTARITWDTAHAHVSFASLDADLVNTLLPSSDTLAGVFNFPKGYQGIYLPVIMIPTKAGSPTLTLTAESDSKFSPTEIKIKTPIK